MITLEQFKQMIPLNTEPEQWYEVCIKLFPAYSINTTNRIAGFMAQTGAESSDFKLLVENMNYSIAGLLKTFPSYFTTQTAKDYARNPQKIANWVYDDANRKNKLGNIHSGDGWRFRGHGILQITGRYNFEEFGKSVNMTAEQAIDYIQTKEGAVTSALWIWKTKNINASCDADDIVLMSEKVNGGTIGLAGRKTRYATNKNILGVIVASTTPSPTIKPSASLSAPVTGRILGRGSRGDDVKAIQGVFNLIPDGIFGIGTEEKVRSWQMINKTMVTGKVTPEQYKQIIGA